MRDGLYRVETKHFCAGFVVEGGQITRVAPVLRKNIFFWMKVAERVDGIPEKNSEKTLGEAES
jgi:hypothetical protein